MKILRNGFLIVTGVMIAGLLAELFFRTQALQPLYAIRYCHLGWCHMPGVVFTHGAETKEFVTHVAYNSRGLRDREYPYEKAAGTRRILVFGDSYAEVLEVELEHGQ